jgi:hypothetical protein
MQELETVLGSAVAKYNARPKPQTVTDLGAFDNEDDQRAYLECYVPEGFLDTDSGKSLVERAGYWLHGRYVPRQSNDGDRVDHITGTDLRLHSSSISLLPASNPLIGY